ncbi:MAG: orotidine-5'-phosphate decarboxylase [Nitrospirota bacterium]
MKKFIDRLIDKIKEKKSHVVVGLDPDYDNLPKPLKDIANNLAGIGEAIFEFNRNIIDMVYDLVPAIKPQIAFYERYGIEGIMSFLKTVQYGKEKGLIVIEDAKRNDIGSTATAYSDGHIGRINVFNQKIPIFDVDAITINPYLGSDGILPFIKDVQNYQKGIFVLVKTSNNSSVEIQDINVILNEQTYKLYEVIAKLVNKWGENNIGIYGYSSIGAVVGATFPTVAKVLRKIMSNTYFLVPGYGAQGGTARDIIESFNKDGFGSLINASRSINFAYKHNRKFNDYQFADAAREAVIKMNKEINNELEKNNLLNWQL